MEKSDEAKRVEEATTGAPPVVLSKIDRINSP